nr:axonemal dynein light chain [Homo sapiens]
MIPPADSFAQVRHPSAGEPEHGETEPQGRLLKVSPQQPGPSGSAPQPPKTKLPSTPCVPDPTKQAEEILNAILPPREWVEDTQLWIQQVSSTPTHQDGRGAPPGAVRLKAAAAAGQGNRHLPCPQELYSQCFDELIRESPSTVRRGGCCCCSRDEIRMTIAAYQTLYESSVAFGMRKALQAEQGKSDMERKIAELETEKRDLERQVNEQKAKCEATEKRESERRQVEEKKHNEEIQFLKRTNQQLKAQLEGIIAPKK